MYQTRRKYYLYLSLILVPILNSLTSSSIGQLHMYSKIMFFKIKPTKKGNLFYGHGPNTLITDSLSYGFLILRIPYLTDSLSYVEKFGANSEPK